LFALTTQLPFSLSNCKNNFQPQANFNLVIIAELIKSTKVLKKMQAPSKVNPDIQEERKRVQFNVEEFTNWFYGGKENVDRKRSLGKNFFKELLKALNQKAFITNRKLLHE
jgi:hypothetical protein